MTTKKPQPLTKKDLQEALGIFEGKIDKRLNSFATNVDKRFDAQDEHFKNLDSKVLDLQLDMKDVKHSVDEVNQKVDVLQEKVLDLQLDMKDVKRNLGEVEQKVDIVQDSVFALDKRVRFQDDFPERLEQTETDIHGLKREVHKIKTAAK